MLELVRSAPQSGSLTALPLTPQPHPPRERSGGSLDLATSWRLGSCFVPLVPRSRCSPRPLLDQSTIPYCIFYSSAPTDGLMFSRASQIARHLSRPLPNLAHSSAATLRGTMSSGPAAAAATAAQRASSKIHTAACLIIGDEVLGGKACYFMLDRQYLCGTHKLAETRADHCAAACRLRM